MDLYISEASEYSKRIYFAKREIGHLKYQHLLPVISFLILNFPYAPLIYTVESFTQFLTGLINGATALFRLLPAVYYITIGTLIKCTAKRICTFLDEDSDKEQVKALIKKQKILCAMLILTPLVCDLSIYLIFKDIQYVTVGSFILGYASMYEAILGVTLLFKTIKGEKLLFVPDYSLEKRKNQVSALQRKIRSGFAYSILTITFAGVLLFRYSFNKGNPITHYKVWKNAKEYVNQNYPQYNKDCYLDSVDYYSTDGKNNIYHVVYNYKEKDQYINNITAFTILYSDSGEYLGDNITKDYAIMRDMIYGYENKYTKLLDSIFAQYITPYVNYDGDNPFAGRKFQYMCSIDDATSELSEILEFKPMFDEAYLRDVVKQYGKITINVWNGEFSADDIYGYILTERDMLDENEVPYRSLGGTYSEQFMSMNLDKMMTVGFTYEELHSENFREIFDAGYEEFKEIVRQFNDKK